ncbi:3090_t:CDS:1, partial [Cetraspora pellucida]
MDSDFDLSRKRYVDWPQPIDKAVINDALAEFREAISCNSLRELSCAICSGLFSHEHLTIIATEQICLPLLEIDKDLEKLTCKTDFMYGHPHIDESGYRVLLDKNGFVKNTDNENLFDLR